MKLTPVLTEKSLKDAKSGFYTFWVDRGLTKDQIKSLIGKTFSVHVRGVRVINYKKEMKKNFRGFIKTVKPAKKAIVALNDKEKIDLFEEKTK